IVMDSLRADSLGCYGADIRTPNIDRFAREGVLFSNAFTESLPTLPTRTTWWTGRASFPFRPWQPFAQDDILLSEILWSRGFTSALVTDVYHMHKPMYNCGRGFDTTVFVRGQECDPWIVDGSIPVDFSRHRLRGDETDDFWQPVFEQYLRKTSVFGAEEDYFAPRVATEAVRWLNYQVEEKGIQDRLFLWADFFDPHEPWDPPEPWCSMYDPEYEGQELIDPVPGDVAGYMTPRELEHTRALYAGEITFVDKWVGWLLDEIRRLGLWENTLLMLTSDHGEPFGEHGYVRKARPYAYEELVHIPWLIRHPEGSGAGTRIDALVQTTDLMPTILDALAISWPPEPASSLPGVIKSEDALPLHGESLLPLMRGEVPEVRRYAYSGHHGSQWSVRDREWSYLLDTAGSRDSELYYRVNDPMEQFNVISQHREIADMLELELRRWAAALQ
ncbi:MAG: sulfatase, partial [Anaerolineae bacterium]|nr:sulfatase [Anaerolineae bacterium]